MVNAPFILLPRQVLRYGLFQHAILPSLRLDYVPVPAHLPMPPPAFALCETRLPADFCTCGVYMLFVDDAIPDDPQPPDSPTSPPPETPCPPGPLA